MGGLDFIHRISMNMDDAPGSVVYNPQCRSVPGAVGLAAVVGIRTIGDGSPPPGLLPLFGAAEGIVAATVLQRMMILGLEQKEVSLARIWTRTRPTV